MGRPESPLDPEAGPVERFAFELRELRRQSGGVTYRAMAESAGYTAATLSEAAAGERLPSLPVALAYVRACGGDADDWERRWQQAAEDEAGQPPEADGSASPYRGLARFEPGDSGFFFGREQLVADLAELVLDSRFVAVVGTSGSGKSSLLRAGLIPLLRGEDRPGERPAAIRILTPGVRPAHTHARALAPVDGAGDTWVVVDQFEEVFTLCRDPAERGRFIELLLAAVRPDSRLRVVIAVRADFYGRCGEHRDLAAALRGAGLLVGPMSADELREAIVKPAAAEGLVVERALTARIIADVADQPGGLPLMSHALMETWRRRRGGALTVKGYQAVGGVHGAIARTAEECYNQLSAHESTLARQVMLRLIAPGEGTDDTSRPARRAELAAGSADTDTDAVLDLLAGARLITLDDDTVDLAHEALITAWPRLRDWIERDRDLLRRHRLLTEAATAWNQFDRDAGVLYRGARLTAATEAFLPLAGPDPLTPLERSFLTASLDARHHEQRQATRNSRRLRVLTTALTILVALATVVGLTAWNQNTTGTRQHLQAEARRIAAMADSIRSSDPRTAMRLSAAAYGLADLPDSRSALLDSLAQTEQDRFDPGQDRFDPGQGPASTGDSDSDSAERRFLSRDGRLLTKVTEGRVERWNTSTEWRIGSFPGPGGLEFPGVEGISPDGNTLMNWTEGGLRLWDIEAGRQVGARIGSADDSSAGTTGSFVTDTRILLSSRYPGGSGVRFLIWDTVLGRSVFEQDLREEPTADSVASPDGRLLAICPRGGPVQVWDTAERRKLPTPWATANRDLCPTHQSRFGSAVGGPYEGRLLFTPDSRALAVVGDFPDGSGVRAWDLASGKRRMKIEYSLPEGAGTRMTFSADGGFVAVESDDEILLWRTADPDVAVFRHPLSSTGSYDLDETSALRLDLAQRRIRYLEVRGWESSTSVASLALDEALDSAYPVGPVRAATYSPDGRTLAAVRRLDGATRFQLLDAATAEVLADLPNPQMFCLPDPGCENHTAFSADGGTFAYGAEPPAGRYPRITLYVWDTRTRRQITSLSFPADVEGIGLSPDGKTLLVSRIKGSGAIELWDVHSRTRTRVLHGVRNNPVVRPDGRLLATSGGDYVELLADSRAYRMTHRNTSDPQSSVVFSPDGRYLAVGGRGGVTIWDGSARRRLANLPATPDGSAPPAGGNGVTLDDKQLDNQFVTTLAFSPDARYLAVGTAGGTLQIWQTEAPHLQAAVFPSLGGRVQSVAFSPDGGTLYAASTHRRSRSYDLDPEHVAATVCERAGGGLSRADWKSYLPDVPYRDVC
ncbi:helix-turn-helix domain-containing protein [Streptomyces sp. SID12501]|uniref:Helix-turn-helix domain-containing protein n=1 Tax=Streptomyces sp. SID12501 TaxID=2706042 RepID=A0A6B3BZ23_9ACTN|nr:helix-turn-helix domain-containing protein [Streptomyces sp. SID12501]NEC89598.1 helix-turn-helix domain-containing protein [Streptomyces sp. SID12501]